MVRRPNYVRQEKLTKILKAIRELQDVKYPPLKSVTKKQVLNYIKQKSSIDFNVYPRLMRRAFNKLCKQEKLLEYPEEEREYWLPDLWKKSVVCQRKARESAEKDVEDLKQQKKELVGKNKIDEIILENLQVENEAIVELAKPYFDNLRYCESDQDWELLTKWFMKMHENKHYQESAEAWEQDQKEQAEISKEEEQKNRQT